MSNFYQPEETDSFERDRLDAADWSTLTQGPEAPSAPWAQETRSARPPSAPLLGGARSAKSPSASWSPPARKRKRSRGWRFWVIIAACVALVLVPTTVYGFSLYQTYSSQYQQDRALAQAGVQHLQAAEKLLKNITSSFDQPTIIQARQDFSAALTEFTQVKSGLEQIPGIATAVPKYGALLSSALHIVPLAIEVCQAGIIGTNALNLLAPHLHGILSTKAQGLTTQDIATITQDVNQVQALLGTAKTQINQLQPADLQIDPRIGPAIAAFRANLPTIQTTLQSVQQVLAAAPALLGIGTPASYLIEDLDSTELRPGGGFIGSYGLATFSGGNLSSLRLTDTYLLDKPYEYAGHIIAFPSDYRWFPLAPSWSLRDSNLDADFPTEARYAEQLYRTEGGTAKLQGVIAITPAIIQGLLNLTGPIYVSQYKETITAQNLINRIHFHQLHEELAGGDNPSPDGLSSLRKHFTAVLFEDFFAKLRQIAPTAMPKIETLLVNSLHTKDVQIYLNDTSMETLLQNYQIASKMLAPAGDTLMVVDANIIANKANYFMTYTMRDQVTIDTQGNAIHHTTLTYNWPRNPASLENDYGGTTTVYRDYLRVYAPSGSILQAQSGWTPQGTSHKFGLEVWAGIFQLQYGHSGTVSLTWTVHGAATHDAHGWHYTYLIQRQAGIGWKLNLHVTLPACAQHVTNSAVPLDKTDSLTQFLSSDLHVGLNYTC